MRIRKIYFTLFSIICLMACNRNLDCLHQVDDAILERPYFEARHRAVIDSLENCLALQHEDSIRFVLLENIFELFKCNDLDSAEFYSSQMPHISDNVASRSAYSYVLASRRNYYKALEVLDEVPRQNLSDRDYLKLCDAYQSVCSAANNDSGLPEAKRREFVQKKLQFQELSLTIEDLTDFEKLYYKGRLLASNGENAEAVEFLSKSMDLTDDLQKKLHCTYTISNCYKDMGMMDESLDMLCKTAVLDFTVCNRQYRSLYDLSLYLYRHNNPEKAANYIQTTIIDAIQCNHSVRIVNAVDAQNIINATRQKHDDYTKMVMFSGILLLFVFSLVSYVQYRRIKKKRDEIKAINDKVNELNRELSKLNESLQEEGVIKDRCLFRYMTLTAKFIDNIEDYRRLLRKTLKEQGIESLKEKLSQQDYLYMQYDTFYKLFDEIFVSIFPDFIDRVNSMLPEGEKFELKKDGSFSTELRVLAVMRLGITKSSRIAEFLNCPVGSVYTNKANIKSKLNCEDSSLEKVVSSL